MIDIVQALNALETAQKGREDRIGWFVYLTDGDGERCLVGEALHLLGVSDDELLKMGGTAIEKLYERGELPVALTLGALVVFRSAQRTQDGATGDSRTWGAAFDAAITTAGRFMALMPETVVAPVAASILEMA